MGAGDVTLVIIQRVDSNMNPHVWHHVVASPDAPTAPQARGAHQRDEERSHPNSVNEKIVAGNLSINKSGIL